MVLLRRVIGDALRARRQGQHRTLREVSTAANVSLGYLSEIERGQKEASSELLSSICDALDTQLSQLLREASDTLALAEQMEGVLVGVGDDETPPELEPARVEPTTPVLDPAQAPEPAAAPAAALATRSTRNQAPVRQVATDGKVSVSVHQTSPLKATLRAKRNAGGQRDRDVVFAA
ncbi:helix-turn-helix transcriptional regulator [Asanoa sp. WMMD1127]|uniref:helix-turn-helix domain-containing protein n=1 Tax=Asanoa sp. WMMD1127 TaxID=3016107 RepID=UPI002417488C|nr:helix-turn-helix transcriptional regulator [Asanoa sp. WMMD1127]MDG4823690.1 helix-turn-helix transcriptional regulator [Asanoa sp. WMMD1127]